MPAAITLDDLLTAYRDAGFVRDCGDEGASRKELSALWKCGERMVSRNLQMARDAGILRVGNRIVQDISGRRNNIPVYSFIEKPKRTKR
jgi:hypothetical protein